MMKSSYKNYLRDDSLPIPTRTRQSWKRKRHQDEDGNVLTEASSDVRSGETDRLSPSRIDLQSDDGMLDVNDNASIETLHLGPAADFIHSPAPAIDYLHSDDEMLDVNDNASVETLHVGSAADIINSPAPTIDYVQSDEETPMVDQNDCNKPLYPNANITKAMSQALIMGFALRHHVSDIGLGDVIHLLDAHMPQPIYGTKYRFLKDFKDVEAKEVQKFFYCVKCFSILEVADEKAKCGTALCPEKDIEKSVEQLETQEKNFFFYLPIKNQLAAILNNKEIFNKLRKDRPGGITSGKIYQKLVKSKEIGKDDITLQFNTDGARSFKSSQNSIWPLQVAINELSFIDRKRNIILAGLWFGGKPKMNTFLTPFVEELQQLHDEGIILKDGKKVKVHCLVSPVDTIARPVIQNFIQFNGEWGCPFCLHRGEKLTDVPGNVRVYRGNAQGKRTIKQHMKDMEKAVKSGKPENGIKGPSVVMLIPLFDIIKSFTPDYMHNVLLGVVKMFLCKWLKPSNSKEPWYLGRGKLKVLNKRLKSIRPPSEISRFPSDFKHRKSWKASEFRSWLLYYSIPCLNGILPALYFDHFCLLVFSITVFLKENISDNDFRTASLALKEFVLTTEDLYSKQFMTFNMHLLLHIPECVQNWGALWDSSCFIFEHYNGVLLDLFHGSQYVPHQIVKNYFRVKCLNELFITHFSDLEKLPLPVEKLFHNLCGRFVFEYEKSNKLKISPLGSGKGGRNNSVVKLKNNQIFEVKEILNETTFVGDEYLSNKAINYSHFINDSFMPSPVSKGGLENKIIKTKDIKNKCVFIKFEESMYIADIVNRFERD